MRCLRVFFALFCPITLLMGQAAPSGTSPSEMRTLLCEIVQYDKEMSARTSQADIVVIAESDGRLLRIRYAPNGFGFDAPPAKTSQLVPPDMLSNENLRWAVFVHAPRNPDERDACTAPRKRFAPGKNGALVEVDRFTPVPGKQVIHSLQSSALPCYILDRWTVSSKKVAPSTPPQAPQAPIN